MLLSGKDITLRIYLRTDDNEVDLVKLGREDLEKAAMDKTNFSEGSFIP